MNQGCVRVGSIKGRGLILKTGERNSDKLGCLLPTCNMKYVTTARRINMFIMGMKGSTTDTEDDTKADPLDTEDDTLIKVFNVLLQF